MLLSVFTPTHDTTFLDEAYQSLLLQKNVDWEWVLAPNAVDLETVVIPQRILDDKRVRVCAVQLEEEEKPSIGKLKRYAVDNCQGDAFVELDHDDMLVPGVLEKIAGHINKGVGFVYSDAAVFIDDKKAVWPVGYGEAWGWETYELRVFGVNLLASRAFDAEPRSLCEVMYAPDHVRAWSREAYYNAGGHDPKKIVGDDHDLICRTYLAGYRFAHTGGCGYLYRNHPGNTVKTHSKEIREQQDKNRDKYFYELIEQWITRTGHQYLNLNRKTPNAKLLGSGELKIDARDETIGHIRCFDFLQFVPPQHFMQAWEEIYRVLVPGGFICTATPSTEGDGAFAPHHKSYWNEASFQYVSDWEFARELGVDFPKARFQLVRCGTAFPDERRQRHGTPYVFADLCALKGQRQPGKVRI